MTDLDIERVRELEARYWPKAQTDPVFSAKVKAVREIIAGCFPVHLDQQEQLAAVVAVGFLEEFLAETEPPPIYRDVRQVCGFVVHGEPVSKERPRVTPRGTITPEKTRTYEERVGWSARATLGRYNPDTAKLYRVEVHFRLAGRWEKDVDNMSKCILDGLNGIIYPDDKQVVELRATKDKANRSTSAGARVTVYEVEAVAA